VEILNHPTVSVAQPIVISVLIASWSSIRANGKFADQVSKRIDDLRADMNTRMTAIESRLGKLEDRVSGLQERAWR
jgi:hypothetical protein